MPDLSLANTFLGGRICHTKFYSQKFHAPAFVHSMVLPSRGIIVGIEGENVRETHHKFDNLMNECNIQAIYLTEEEKCATILMRPVAVD